LKAINAFPVRLAVALRARSQVLSCTIQFGPGADAEAVSAARDVVDWFAKAGSLGMLSGGTFGPERARLDVRERTESESSLEFTLTLTEIPAASCRVLIGMLRGQILLDGAVTGVDITSSSGRLEPPSRLSNEESLPLPGLTESLSFTYVREPSMRLTDRGIRVRFRKPLNEDLRLHLGGIQAAWQAVCEGGCCPEGVPAVEATMLCEPGIVVAPSVFEIKIAVFNNQERCFDYFANAMEQMSRAIQQVDRVEVW
jgi:hypothetical protein